MKKTLLSVMCFAAAALTLPKSFAQQTETGPNSSQSPYVIPTIPGAKAVSILTVGDEINGYKMAGIPDGLGAYDNGDGTFTVLMNHELGATAGVVRAHGSAGAFVSKWIINKSDFSVISGSDLIQNVMLWDNGTQSYVSNTTAFGRFCSADLPAVSAFYNSATGLGTQHRIYMNGEENGVTGRAFANIATGPAAGTSYELPLLGKYSYENTVANPATGDKTVVIGLDDSSPGEVYVYIGEKTNTGNDIEKAGLTNGQLYGLAVSGIAAESNSLFPATSTPFSLVPLGDVAGLTGAELQTASIAEGVTRFLRPEDGAWDPRHPENFYFVTTNAFNQPSRLYKLQFSDLNDLTLGGTITAVLDGSEGQQMLDNVGFDNYGHLIMQEDVGNQTRLGKTWQYNVDTDVLIEIASHDPSRFLTGGANFLTQDEEASGTIDMEHILGAGWSIIVDQAHYNIPGELVQGGQFLAFFNPDSYIGNKRKVSMCKNGQTISVAIESIPALLSTGATLEPCLSSNNRMGNVETTQNVTIHPNPTTDNTIVSLNLSETENVMIKIFDLQGKEVMQPVINNFEAGNHKVIINTSELKEGIYFVQVTAGSETSKIKLIIN